MTNLRRWLWNTSNATVATAMVSCALLLRLAVVALSYHARSAPSPDFNQFGAEMGWVARSLALGHGFSSPFFPATGPTALMPPIFPYLLSCVFRVCGLYSPASAFAILSIESLLSALTCIPIYLTLADAVGQRQARIAGFLWAVYPFAIYYCTNAIWDYALTSFLFAWCFYFAQRLHLRDSLAAWFGFGLLYGITALSNPSILSVLPFLFLFTLWKVHRVRGPWILRTIVTVLAFLAAVMPWTIRNYRAMHALVPIRDGLWLEVWAGNHGDTSTPNPSDAHPASSRLEMHQYSTQGETVYLANKRTASLNYIQQHPASFAIVSLRRAFRFWTGFWSFSPEYLHDEMLDVPNVFFCTFVTVMMLQGVRRWWREDPSRAISYLILILVFPLLYYVTHSSMDYRQPIEPEIVILVTIGIFGFAGVEEEDPELPRVAQWETRQEVITFHARSLG